MKVKNNKFVIDGKEYFFIAGGAPEGDDGNKDDKGDKGDKDDKKDKDPKYFTQDEVNRFMNSHKKELKSQNSKYEKQVQELNTQIKEMKDLVSQFTSKDDDDDDGDSGKGNKNLTDIEQMERRLDYERKQHNKKITGFEGTIKDLEDKAAKAETRRLQSERDRVLDEALVEAGCSDLKNAKKIFRDQMEYDEEAEDWYFNTSEGVRMNPKEGVDTDLPSYLRSSKAKRGSGGKSPKARLEGEYEKQKTVVEDLAKKANLSGRDTDIASLLREQRTLKKLENEIKK